MLARDPRSLFRLGSMMGWSARSTLTATGDALSEPRIGKAMDVHAEIMRNDLSAACWSARVDCDSKREHASAQ